MPSEAAAKAPRVAGVVLAAGASRRLGVAKQLLRDDESGLVMVARAAQQLLNVGCSPVVVVTGAEHERMALALSSLPVSIYLNREWSDGVGTSISGAIKWLSSLPESSASSAALIVACDMPSVTVAHLHGLLKRSNGAVRLVASRYEDTEGREVIGIPAIFPKVEWHHLEMLTGDKGARDQLKSPDTLSVFLRMGSFDLDTPDDVARWRAGDLSEP